MWKEKLRRLHRDNHLLRMQVLKMQEERRSAKQQSVALPSSPIASSASCFTPSGESTPPDTLSAERRLHNRTGSCEAPAAPEVADALSVRLATLQRQSERERVRRGALERDLRREIERLRLELSQRQAVSVQPPVMAIGADSPNTTPPNGDQQTSLSQPPPSSCDTITPRSRDGYRLRKNTAVAAHAGSTLNRPPIVDTPLHVPVINSAAANCELHLDGVPVEEGTMSGTSSCTAVPTILSDLELVTSPVEVLAPSNRDDANGVMRRTASRREVRRQRLERTFTGLCTPAGSGRSHTLEGSERVTAGLPDAIPRRWRRSASVSSTVLASNGDQNNACSSAVPFNPNQLGNEILPNERNRTWYQQQVLSMALTHAILPTRKADAKGTTTTTPVLTSASRMGSKDWMEMYFSSDTDMDELTGAMKNKGETPTSSEVGMGLPASNGARVLLYRDVNATALQLAIDETFSSHFCCMHNVPVINPGTKPPKNVKLDAFAEDNTDPNLLRAFSPPHMTADAREFITSEGQWQQSSSRGKEGHRSSYRDDEICVLIHAPVIFSQIRTFLHIDESALRAAARATWRQSMSPGKSGTTLYYFGDYVMKSLHESEFNFVTQKFLPAYVRYCERNPHTLLPRFYLLLSVKWMKLGTTTRFILMQNVFSTRYYINRIYDVKGSTIGRTALQPGKEPPRTAFGALLLKDNDLPEQLLICGQWQRATLLAQFHSDVSFLQGLSVVDYSCMIGVRSRVFTRAEGPSKTVVMRRRTRHHPSDSASFTESAMNVVELETVGVGTATSEDEDDIYVCIHGCDGGLLSLPMYTAGDDTTVREDVYYVGIIDVLQEYTSAKKLENFAKGFVTDRTQISVVPPKDYSERLYNVLERISV